MPLTGSLMFVYICIDVGDPVEGRCWRSIYVLMLAIQ